MPSWINLDLAQILHRLPPEFLKALGQTGRVLVREAEDPPMLDAMFRRILGDAPQNWKPALHSCIDRHENGALDASKHAIQQLIIAGERTGLAWTSPRAPGKWSPSQIVEHVALSASAQTRCRDGDSNNRSAAKG